MKEIILVSTQDEILDDICTLTEFERITARFALYCAIANEKKKLLRRYSDEELMALRKTYNFFGGKHELYK